MTNMNQTLESARRYVEKYGFSVIPLLPNSKNPALPSEKESPNYNPKTFRTRYPTQEELQKWFLNTQNNIGIITGILSGISVVDVDTKSNLSLLQGITSPVTVFSKKGKHLYFKYSEKVGNDVKPFPDVDFRSEGTYVVAPPSIVDGYRYRFLNPYFVVDNLLPFPVELLQRKEEVKGTGRKESGKPSGWVAEALEGMRIGNIDDTLVSVLGRLRHDGYSRADARALLYLTAKEAGATEGHLDDKIEHVWTSYENKKVSVSGVSLSVDAFLSKESKVEWICYPLIPKQGLIFTAGLPESQKSWLLMDLAIESAIGGKWLQLFQTKKSKTLFVDQERALPETQRRFKALLANKGLDKEDLKDNLWIDCSSHRKFDMDNSYEAFKRELSEIRPDLVIIDSFVTVHSKSDNDRTEVQKILDRIKLLREEFGCAFVFIDHESKQSFQDSKENAPPSAMRMVGTVGKVAAADCVLSVTKLNQGLSSVTHTKSTMANPSEAFCFELKDEEKGISIRGTK